MTMSINKKCKAVTNNECMNIVNRIKIMLTVWLLTYCTVTQANKVEYADNLIKNWLSIEQQRNAIINDWSQQKPLLTQRLMLLKQEQAQLEKDINTSNVNDTDVEKKREELLTSQNNMETTQDKLESSLTQYYQLIIELQAQLPPPLSKSWQNKLAETDLQNADTTLRLSTLLTLLEQLNDYQQRISHVQSPLVIPGASGDKEIMVNQLYLGLSQAWYVSLDGSLVGRGQPTPSGWQWSADENVDGDIILNAIAMMERKKEATFLQLPITLSGAH